VSTAIVQALFRVCSHLPLLWLHALGALLGWLVFVLSPTYRRRLLTNARRAGVGLTDILGSVAEAGRLVAELPRLWLGRPVRVGWQGAAEIDAALARGQGVLFLTPHLGCFEVTAQAYAERFGQRHPITVLFRPARQRWLRDLVAQARQRPGLHTAPTTLAGVKQLIKALKSAQAVGLLPDQVPPDGQGVWAPFYGHGAYTMTLSARLAHSAGAQVVLAWGERLSWGRGYLVHVRTLASVLGNEPLASEPVQAASQINRAMAILIAQCPRQYLWAYDRYKAPASAAHTT
jgi:Kdo2-lipid IVA lauroyltransferase/acyltransferase